VIEALFELLFELLGDVILQLVFELVFEFGITSVRHATTASRASSGHTPGVASESTHPLLAAVGCLLLGALSGLVSVLVVPHRILPPPRIPGLSVFLSPLGSGLVMHTYGRWRVARDKSHSRLATFAGGALFAFTIAVTRYLLLRAGG
jgi:hypothetical protein